MIQVPNLLTRLFKDKTEVAIFFSAFLLEIAVGMYLIQRWGFTFNSGDAVVHLYIPRNVVDNGANGGLQNIGTVWLPMFHLLVMPLVLINPFYTTGFAGTIVNALATGGICVILYRLMGGRWLGILASALFIFNAFTLINGATPMMEQTAIFFMVLATYYFKSYWETDDLTQFIKCSLALILGTLTRYEVWAVALLAVFLFSLRELRNGHAYRLAYAHLPFWGCAAWLFWNMAIFRDPLAFIHLYPWGANPSSPQNIYILVESVFLTSGLLGLVAITSFILIMIVRGKSSSKMIPFLLLLSPLGLHIVFSFLNVYGAFIHVRYAYLTFPGFIVLSTALFTGFKNSSGRGLVIPVLLASLLVANITNPIQLTNPPSALIANELTSFALQSRAIRSIIDGSAILITSWTTFGGGGLSVIGGISPQQIVDEYDGAMLVKVSENPWDHVPFVAIPKLPVNNPAIDQIGKQYENKHVLYLYYKDASWRSEFLRHYELFLETENWLVYQLGGHAV